MGAKQLRSKITMTKHGEKKRNKFVNLNSTQTKNGWRMRLWDQNPMSACVVYH